MPTSSGRSPPPRRTDRPGRQAKVGITGRSAQSTLCRHRHNVDNGSAYSGAEERLNRVGPSAPSSSRSSGCPSRRVSTRPVRTTSSRGASCCGRAWPELPRGRAIVGDRAYRGLANLAERRQVALDIKTPPPAVTRFVPLRPLGKIAHAFAQLGRWRRPSRCYEGSVASAKAWLEVALAG